MATYTQAQQMMSVKTPAGEDVFLLAGFSGQEGLSQLFHYQLDLLVEHVKPGPKPIPTEIAIDDLLGESITVEMTLPDGSARFFNGICNRIMQGGSDRDFTSYQMELVPQFWLLTRTARSRIFQPPESAVPQILKEVLKDIEVDWDIEGNFHPRDYCVQYRESDFNFACRLMEEEGIYFYFTHDDGSHKLVVANTPGGHPDMPNGSEVLYEHATGGPREDDRVYSWSKVQQLRSGKYTLWDYCFEKPESKLDATAEIQDSVEVGEKSHKLKVGNNGSYEIYDYPGEYAQRFDGVDKGGGDQPEEIEKIFEDNARTVGIRMQEEAVGSVLIQGTSSCRQFVGGHKFTLQDHPHANGAYVMTTVSHSAVEGSYGGAEGFSYSNSFSCIPAALPFRPTRVTPKPVVSGTQTAVVVGPDGEEIYTDKYGRVKVQFPWDREGTNDAGSSCWIRVGTPWAGPQWGMIHIPRMGHEVIVDFLEGDPDQPIVVGNVYNAANMPPYGLPDNKTQSGIKSRSSLEGTPDNFNEIRFEDKKGKEQLFIHAEKNQDIEVENDESHWVGRDRTKKIDRDESSEIKRHRTEKVGEDERITIGSNRTEEVGKNETITIKGNRSEVVEKDETVDIRGDRQEFVKKNEFVTVKENRSHSVKKDDTLDVGKNLNITAGDQITLTTGDASITMKKNGDIIIKGKNIKLDGSGKINVKASSDVIIKGSKIAEN